MKYMKSSSRGWRRFDRLRAASLLAILAFVGFEFALEAGAEPGPVSRWLIAVAVAAAFAVEIARDAWAFRRRLLHHRWPDLLLGIPGFALLAANNPRAGTAFFVARLVVRELTGFVHWRPARPALDALLRRPIALLCVSFLFTIAAGTIVLLAPAATAPGKATGVLTSLFIATSATCVTGLADVDVASHFSRFGHWVILILIQVGGLGIMSITTALALVFRRALSARARGAMQEILEEETVTGFRRLIVAIVAITLGLEAGGALAIYPVLSLGADGQPVETADRAFHAVFHAVSAFCNAGFSLYPDSFGRFAGNFTLNLVIMVLVVLGGIGFPVMNELIRIDRWWRRGLRGGWAFLPVHARVVLVTTAALVCVGAFAFLVLEWNRSLAGLSGRGTPAVNVYRAAAVAAISLLLLFVLTFLLFAVEPVQPFRSLLFEAVSAFGTVGLSLGTTASLGAPGKLIVCALMFVGRLGPFTLAVAAALSKDQAPYGFPSTKVVVG